MRLWLAKGVLPYIEVVDEIYFLLKVIKEGNKKVNCQKKETKIAPANNRNEKNEANSYTKLQLQFITNGGIPYITPDSQRSLISSTVSTVSLTRSSGT